MVADEFEQELQASMTPEAWGVISGGYVEPTFNGWNECSTCGATVVPMQHQKHIVWHRRIGLTIRAQGYILGQVVQSLAEDQP